MRDFSQLIRERRGDDKHETRRKFSALKLGAIYVLLRINTAGQWKSVRKILRKHWSSGKKGEGSTNEIKCRLTTDSCLHLACPAWLDMYKLTLIDIKISTFSML